MIVSFRLRLALLAVLLTGFILGAFGLATWWLIRDIRTERLDKEVRTQAEREANRTRSVAGWQYIETKLVSDLGVREGQELLLLILDAGGDTVFRSAHWPAGLEAAQLPWPSHSPGAAAPPPPSADGRPGAEPPSAGPPPSSISVSRSAQGQLWRMGLADSGRTRVMIAVDARVVDADMAGVRSAFLVALPLALILTGVGAWIFSGRALRPLRRLTGATRNVTAEGLGQRISSAGEDREFVELIEVFNGMLERLERSFEQARRFSADAAHELKTPLAILQGQLERAIHAAEDGSPMQRELSGILDEVRRLSTISRKLLLLSLADAGRLKLNRAPFPLSRALADLVEDARMLAPQLKIISQVQPDLLVSADASLLPQVLHNLLSNAIKYNLDQGWIRIVAEASPRGLEVSVSNASVGIPEAERDRIFERFYRADPAHGRRIEGVGLGLAVAREIARAHGGDLVLKPDENKSVTFSLFLPLPS